MYSVHRIYKNYNGAVKCTLILTITLQYRVVKEMISIDTLAFVFNPETPTWRSTGARQGSFPWQYFPRWAETSPRSWAHFKIIAHVLPQVLSEEGKKYILWKNILSALRSQSILAINTQVITIDKKDAALLSLKTTSFQFRFALGNRLHNEVINTTLVH